MPVVVFGSDDEQDIAEALIESNRQRIKSGAIVAREAAALAEIERARAKARQGGAGRFGAPVPQTADTGRTQEKVASTLGISPRTAQDAIAVGQELRRLEASADVEDQAKAETLAAPLRATMRG